MRKLCLITFDIIREGEPETAYSIASILSFLKSKSEYGKDYLVDHFSFNLNEKPGLKIDWASQKIDWEQYDFVAISCYIWSHSQSLSAMRWIKSVGVKAKILAGGYQVNTSSEIQLKSIYPHADQFIMGYAEQSLFDILTNGTPEIVQNKPVDFDQIPSPFLDGTISLESGVRRLRLETKRGCPFACTFCAHRNLGRTTLYHLHEKLLTELQFLSTKTVERISVTDPVFNMGGTYIPYLEAIRDLKMDGIFNFQVRPELITSHQDDKLIELLGVTKSQIELGIQTFDPEVNALIQRKNNYLQIQSALEKLMANGIDFGISLIYGLPGQTLKSFANDLEMVSKLGLKNVVAFPLMVLPGTELYQDKEKFGIKEGYIDNGFKIPHVIESSSFTNVEWMRMHEMASKLNPGQRLF